MFKDMGADTYLTAAGIASDWPTGRGCFVSADQKFIVWVGEEDHLRIMCMFKGTKLSEVFKKLEKALEVVSAIPGLEFAFSKTYGNVTSCPSNLGTGMRASVHIKLPNLTSDGTDAKAKAICAPLGLSVRGLGGEHTPIGKDGTVDISPSARFCIKESTIITNLYKGLQELVRHEGPASQPPAANSGQPIDKAHRSTIETITAIKTSHPNNLCCRHFDLDYFSGLSADKRAGLLKIMSSGIDNPDSGLGCYAMQPGDYETYVERTLLLLGRDCYCFHPTYLTSPLSGTSRSSQRSWPTTTRSLATRPTSPTGPCRARRWTWPSSASRPFRCASGSVATSRRSRSPAP